MSDTTTRTSFLGIPVEGHVRGAEKRVEQRPLSELEPLMRAVLDDPTIKAFGWTQYTPYFNDGEPCEFGVGTPWFVGADEEVDLDEVDTYNHELSSWGDGHPSLGKRTRDGTYTGSNEASYDRAKALSDALEAGEFEDVLLEAFGDHAAVRVTRDGITVDEYSHD